MHVATFNINETTKPRKSKQTATVQSLQLAKTRVALKELNYPVKRSALLNST